MVRSRTDLPAPEAPTKPRISPMHHIERKLVEHLLSGELHRHVANRKHDLAGRAGRGAVARAFFRDGDRLVGHQKSIAA